MIADSRERMLSANPAKREDVRKKMSEKAKIRANDTSWRENHSRVMKGKPSPNKGKKQSEEQKKSNGERKRNTVWVNNGEISKMIKKDQLDIFLLNGFIPGRINWKTGGVS